MAQLPLSIITCTCSLRGTPSSFFISLPVSFPSARNPGWHFYLSFAVARHCAVATTEILPTSPPEQSSASIDTVIYILIVILFSALKNTRYSPGLNYKTSIWLTIQYSMIRCQNGQSQHNKRFAAPPSR